jgi:hypothetical protein
MLFSFRKFEFGICEAILQKLAPAISFHLGWRGGFLFFFFFFGQGAEKGRGSANHAG